MSVENIKIGLICVGLEGERNDLAEAFRLDAVKALALQNIEILNIMDSCTLTGEEVLRQARNCERSGADAMVYLIGTWCLASHVIDAVRKGKLPFVIWGIPEPASFSSVGANVVHGTLGELNIKHKLIYGFPEEKAVMEELQSFLRAAAMMQELSGLRMGMIGGRAISAYPTVADPNQIKGIFGIETEHIDQLVLLEKARRIPVNVCDAKIEEMRNRYGSVDVPEEMLRRSVSVYFALKEIIEEQRLDLLSVKCIGEFMDCYSSCCIALSMLNDEGFVCNCQCSLNALISSYILKRLSGQPCFFGDVNVVLKEERSIRLICCGGLPGKLAPSDTAIRIVPQYEYMGAGQGACTFFCMKEGPVTIGTLGRDNGSYVMNIATGRAYAQRDAELLKVRSWAQGFVKLNCDPMEFYRNLRSNHSVVAYGDYKKELLELCGLYDIRPEMAGV